MTEPRKNQRHRRALQENTFRAANDRRSAEAAGDPGRTAYREEFERDRGPDLDESVDGTESEREY